MDLWEHQKTAVEKYKDKEYFGLLFDMGLGKTITALKIAEAKEKDVLIIAPNALCEQWKTEIEKNKEKDIDTFVLTSKTKGKKSFEKDFKEFLCRNCR